MTTPPGGACLSGTRRRAGVPEPEAFRCWQPSHPALPRIGNGKTAYLAAVLAKSGPQGI